MRFSRCVWDRKEGGDRMSGRAYIAAVSGFTLLGLILASLCAFLTRAWHPTWYLFLIVGLAVPVLGAYIAFKSQDWFVSLFGYILVVAGLGAIIGPTVAMYKTGVVLIALMATGGVTLAMSIVGIIFPQLLKKWGAYLLGALLALLCVRIVQGIMAGIGVQDSKWFMPWIEYGAFTNNIIYTNGFFVCLLTFLSV